jgi:hypothetical protein
MPQSPRRRRRRDHLRPLGATIRRATADASGRFLIVDLLPGRYRLAVDGGAR